MEKYEIDYVYKCNEVLKKANVIVLATTYEQKVYTRALSVCYYQGNLYFQTSTDSKKYKQLTKNNNVAFTLKFINFSATIDDVGTWDENPKQLRKYLKTHEKSYESYGKNFNERVMRINVEDASIYEYLENEVRLVQCNLKENKIEIEQIKKIQA